MYRKQRQIFYPRVSSYRLKWSGAQDFSTLLTKEIHVQGESAKKYKYIP